jgi:uroporphyrinogen decarboxylase
MQDMTGIERISNILKRKPVDRIGLFEHFWNDTHRRWSQDGFIKENENMADHFGFDMDGTWAFNMVADLDFEPQVVEETEETILLRDGNGAILRWHKQHASTPEHVDFEIKDRKGWEEKIKPLLTPDRRRINFEAYRNAKRHAAEHNRFFVWMGVNVFELMHPMCGHEYMLMGMALDPDWVKDMVDTYSRLTIELQEILFAEEGYPDGIWYYEDMGFKQKPFFSPGMYKEIIQAGHIRTIDFAHSKNLPVIMHSCGYVEPLLPGMIESGIDCLQVIEIKAGMDLIKLYKQYGDILSFMGGIDVRVLYTNDKEKINRELEKLSRELEKKIQELIRQQEAKNKSSQYTGGQFAWPAPGYDKNYNITSPFGWRMHPILKVRKFHSGIDISGYRIGDNKPAVAAADGVVIFAQSYGGYGNTVIIDHGSNITTLYAHNAKLLVSEGDTVKKGQKISIIGTTGLSTGHHLHFEVRVNGEPVDPMPYFK